MLMLYVAFNFDKWQWY